MEPVGAVLLAVTLGGLLVALERNRTNTLERSRARVSTTVPPGPAPTPTPVPEPSPGPAPAPAPHPSEVFVEIPTQTWQDMCWWSEQTPADANLEVDQGYIITWPVAWAGEEPVEFYMDPPDLADVEATAYWVADDVFVDVVIRPKRPGWGTLMITEGESGPQAVSGEVPWRAQCMKLEVA